MDGGGGDVKRPAIARVEPGLPANGSLFHQWEKLWPAGQGSGAPEDTGPGCESGFE